MSVRQEQSYLRPVHAAIAEAASTPNPGVVGALVWSTLVGDWLRWTGTSWTSVRQGVYVYHGATNAAFASFASGDWFWRFLLRVDGHLEWGTGVGVTDTNLYRQAAGILKTDGALVVAGDLTVTGKVVGGNSAQATVDFGHADGGEDHYARVSVAAAWVTAGHCLVACPAAEATADHEADDVAYEGITAYPTNIEAGVGFDIIAHAPRGTWGRYLINVRG